ncbi:hypothetical protein BY458DRAFT_441589 [Sporodiniella umbellata]|nr:hypothetical protein BY458DRAFT_441589 [Sporodiniella umbellata]
MKKAIWKWIECCPSEFAEVFTASQPIAESELLFDVCNLTADSSKKRAILWPLQTIILILSTQSLQKACTNQSSEKCYNFLSLLKKSLQTTSSIDLIVVCYVDICKAATYVPPHEESALRMMAKEVEKDLRNKIWDFTKLANAESSMSTLGYTIDQKALATDFLLSRIRLDKKDAINSLVPSCIHINSPITLKLALVRSCLAILLEENHLPWNPTLESLYDGLCKPLRELLLQTIQIETDTKKKDTHINNHTSRVELLVDILRLYREDPFFAILGEGNRVEENGRLMSGLASLLTYSVQVVRQAAAELLVKLHRIEHASHWTQNPNDMREFWKVSSPAIIVISQSMMDTALNGKMQKFMLDTMIKLLKTRTAFLKQKQNMLTRESVNTKEAVQASISLEIALLVFLSSAHKDVCDESSVCIKALCQESKTVDIWDEGMNSITLTANLEVYEILSADNYQFIGRKAQQKKFRKCLQSLLHHTPSCFAAWEEVYKRWRLLTPLVNKQEENEETTIEANISNKKLLLVGKPDRTKTSNVPSPTISRPQQNVENYEEKSLEWQNFTGFLAALGGCCLTRDREMEEVISFSSENSRQTANQPIVMVDGFVAEMTDMLVSDNVYIREGIKDILGIDLSSDLFAVLFRHLENHMSKCFDSNGKAVRNPENKLFVEQSVLVLKLILDRLNNPGDCLLNIDFSTLIHQFIGYLDGVPNTLITLRIKIKMCMLVESLMQKKERIIIQEGVALRNRILEILVEWTSDVTMSRKSTEGGPQMERLQQDLDYACIKAIVKVLHELPLQPLDTIRAYDTATINNRLFLKYFNLFRSLLDRYKRTERDFASHRLNSENKDLSFKPSSDSYQHITMMKELTILAMSHLLSANVETGLKYSLSMGYDDDEKTRTSFMQVLTNILEHGTEFDMLAEGVTTERYEKLVDMLVGANKEVVLALCDVCPSSDISDLAEALLICFESRHKTPMLFKAIVDREVAQTEQEATLFRGTTMATRILSLCAKLTCMDYIRVILTPVFEYINSLPYEKLTWELDPQKARPNEDVSKNMQNVIHVTEVILNAILPTANSVPLIFRQELDVICRSVSARFPESKYTAVGSFVFLRLFGPVIVSPENAGFGKTAVPKDNNVRKILLQAARIIQNLSSNVIFGAMETHMIRLNEFLTKNAYNVMAFLRQISTIPSNTPPAAIKDTRMDQTGYIRLHKYLSSNLERVSKELTVKHMTKRSNAEKALRCKKTLDDFSTILAQLGRPSEMPNVDLLFKKPGNTMVGNQHYAEFMRKNAHRDLSTMSAANMFYLGGKSKAGRPVFYVSVSSIKVDMDFELYIYYALKVMEPYLNSPFEFLIDYTEFTSTNLVPNFWIGQFFQLIGREVETYLVEVHLYNPNTYLQYYLTTLPSYFSDRIIKGAKVYSSLVEISQNIAISELRLPKSTLDLERESCVTIHPVIKAINSKSSVQVTMKIGSEEIQLITSKKQKLYDNVYAIIKDVYHISDFEEVASHSPGKSESGKDINIRYDRGKSTMLLSSSQRDSIVVQLRRTRQRYEASKPSNINDRTIRPNDVPGRLLNMALLNMGSADHSLRLAAYSLLYSISLSFKFNIGNRLLNAKAIVSLAKLGEPKQKFCLEYIVPWLQNLGDFSKSSHNDHLSNAAKTKEVIAMLVGVTIKNTRLYKHMQAKVWKTLADTNEVTDIVLDCFIQESVKSGAGSVQAELITDTLVTMSSVLIRGKVISRMRRLIEGTSSQPCRQLADHSSWKEIAIVLRFILMLSFNNAGSIVTHVPEIYHIVSILVVTGPTFIRSSVHELVVNTIHAMCTINSHLPEENIKKLKYVLSDVCDSKNRVLFGLTKQTANAFTITKDTTTDYADSINLASLQNIIRLLMDTLNYGAATQDIANIWRARWMSLAASTAFYFNPAVQPRAFVVLGCLSQDEVDDDLLYQILVALKGALSIFTEAEPNLIISIMMCLANMIDNLAKGSRYLLHAFWLTVGLAQIGHPSIFQPAVELLHAVLRALDSRKMFALQSIEEVLLESRVGIELFALELDRVCGVNFSQYFSFSVAAILLKGFKQYQTKDSVYQCLCAFLEIDSKRTGQHGFVESRCLGYLAGLLPFAAKENVLRELLHIAGFNELDIDNIDLGMSDAGLFDFLEIPDNSTALLLVSLLVALLNSSETESDKLFLYNLLADAANSVQDVFALVYESLLPKMNQVILSSQNYEIIEAVKSILLTACSEKAFTSETARMQTQKLGLESLKFLALADPTFGAVKTNVITNAKLVSGLLQAITDQE